MLAHPFRAILLVLMTSAILGVAVTPLSAQVAQPTVQFSVTVLDQPVQAGGSPRLYFTVQSTIALHWVFDHCTVLAADNATWAGGITVLPLEQSGFQALPSNGGTASGTVWMDADEPGYYRLDCSVFYAAAPAFKFAPRSLDPVYLRVE